MTLTDAPAAFGHAHDLPPVDAAKLPRLIERMRAIVGPDGVLTSRAEMAVYECDGFTVEKNPPNVVVFPESTAQVVEIVKACVAFDVPFMARGAGTSLAGGCVPVGGGVMIGTSRMKKILEVNVRDRYAVVEAGVVNVWLSNQLKPLGYHYAPDPSSQGACTLGGNVATNSGGPHTLKYGVTVNHVLGVEMVLPDGRVVVTGGPTEDAPGYDLTGAIVGSEGTFGIVTKVWVRVTRNPEATRTLLGVFDSIDDATNTISDIIGAGIVPAALELLDKTILGAVEAAFHLGFPLDAAAVLLMEVDGLEVGLQCVPGVPERCPHRDIGPGQCRTAASCGGRQVDGRLLRSSRAGRPGRRGRAPAGRSGRAGVRPVLCASGGGKAQEEGEGKACRSLRPRSGGTILDEAD